jgi:hypothetical protein
MEDTCTNYQKCPIYNGVLSNMTMTASYYKNQYCNAGSDGWAKCKRYVIKQKTGTCPPELLPNSLKSIEEIIKQYQLKVLS